MTFLMTPTMCKYVRLQRTWAAKIPDDCLSDSYEHSCQVDLESIKKVLPKILTGDVKILDIGAGLGGIDVLLHNYYYLAGCDPKIWILDKEETCQEIKYGFSKTPSAYNSLETTRDFFEANGIKKDSFVLSDVFPENIQFDIIISLISCGFHYPLSEYMTNIKKALHEKTVVIFDIRKNSGQFETLYNTFGRVDCLQDNKRYKRMGCRGYYGNWK